MNSEKNDRPPYLQLVQPQILFWGLLTYSIGVGLAQHLGARLDWVNSLLGVILCGLFIVIRNYLQAYYDHPFSPTCELHTEDPRYLTLKKLDRQTLLVISLTLLTACALDIVLLIFRQALSVAAILFVLSAFLISYFSAIPPLRLEKRGYGEILEAILVSNLFPIIGYLLNRSDLHVLLIMLTLPLTLLYIANRIILSLETYPFDRTHKVQTLVVRLDWQKAMITHNYLLLLSFIFVGLFALLGQPWSLTWPMFLPILIAIFQIVQVVNIMAGAPPRWKILKFSATSTYVVMAYLISFTLWIS